jgi:HTH-type transcriptional regulator / antitoxin HipB
LRRWSYEQVEQVFTWSVRERAVRRVQAPRRQPPGCGDNPPMAQGKRISAEIDGTALQAIKDMGAAAKQARLVAGEGQAAAAARLGVHVQTIARIEAGEPGVAIGHVMGLLALYGMAVSVLPLPDSGGREP